MQSVSFFVLSTRSCSQSPPLKLNTSRFFSEKRENFLYIEQKYGGHLGFYEGGYVIPNQITWLDKSVVGLADALAAYASSGKQMKNNTLEDEEMLATFDKELTPAYKDSSDSGAESDNFSGKGEDDDFFASLHRAPRMEIKAAAAAGIRQKRTSAITFVCKRRRLSVASSRKNLVNSRMVI